MSFTKIKYSKGDVLLQWKDASLTDTTTHELTSSDAPRPELLTALQAMERFVIHIAELERRWMDGLTVQSVNITENDQGRGIVVTALKKVSGAASPIVINTPFLSELPTSPNGPSLPGWAIDLLDALEVEAGRYRAFERSQQELFTKEKAA